MIFDINIDNNNYNNVMPILILDMIGFKLYLTFTLLLLVSSIL